MLRIRHALAPFVVAAALGACMTPSIRTVMAPDGQRALFVECGTEEGTCFELAGQSCPHGYDIRPAVLGRGGSYLVRCRYAPLPVAQAQAPMPWLSPPPPTSSSQPGVAAQSSPSSGVPTATFPSGTSSQQQPTTAQPGTQPGSNPRWPPPNEPGSTALPWDDLDLGY